MTRRVRLGRVAGVEVAVDWSWVFTFALAAWTLFAVADRLLVARRPVDLVVLSAAAAVGLFASLAVHEVTHALAARACGVPVKRLTLFLFGGITDVERDPASPHSESIAALVAPLTNALVGAAFLGLAVVLESRNVNATTGIAPLLVFLVLWLGAVNLALALWNLVPAFPLDGGRLVRAAIWRATGDVERATRTAAWVGQLIGWGLVLLGVALALGGRGLGVIGGMWVALAGWFLASAAAQAYEGVTAQTALAGVTVARLMRRRPEATPAPAGATVVARPTDDAASVHSALVERDLDRLWVVEDGLLIGVVERRDVERWIATHAVRPAEA